MYSAAAKAASPSRIIDSLRMPDFDRALLLISEKIRAGQSKAK